jgi:hypothetical protein
MFSVCSDRRRSRKASTDDFDFACAGEHPANLELISVPYMPAERPLTKMGRHNRYDSAVYFRERQLYEVPECALVQPTPPIVATPVLLATPMEPAPRAPSQSIGSVIDTYTPDAQWQRAKRHRKRDSQDIGALCAKYRFINFEPTLVVIPHPFECKLELVKPVATLKRNSLKGWLVGGYV